MLRIGCVGSGRVSIGSKWVKAQGVPNQQPQQQAGGPVQLSIQAIQQKILATNNFDLIELLMPLVQSNAQNGQMLWYLDKAASGDMNSLKYVAKQAVQGMDADPGHMEEILNTIDSATNVQQLSSAIAAINGRGEGTTQMRYQNKLRQQPPNYPQITP